MGLIFVLGVLLVIVKSGTAYNTCSRSCSGNRKFAYISYHTYTYLYKSDITTQIEGATGDKASIHLTALVHLYILQQCEISMKLSMVDFSEFGQENSEMKRVLENFKIELERNPTLFSYQDGKISDICLSAIEPPWVLNVKRGIISLLQNNMDDFSTDLTVSEIDIFGVCNTTYTVITSDGDDFSIEKSKDLVSCADRHSLKSIIQGVPYTSKSYIKSLPLLKSDYKCRSEIQTGLMKNVKCEERHMFRPFSKSDSGATTVNIQSLTLVVTSSDTELQGVIIARTSLKFEHTHDFDKESKNGYDLMMKLSEICKNTKSGVTSDTPNQFKELVNIMKSSDKDTLSAIDKRLTDGTLCKDNSFRTRKFFLDALPEVGTRASVHLITHLISSNIVEKSEADMWLTSLSFIKHPTKPMLREILALVTENIQSERVMLTVGTLIHSYCVHNVDCNDYYLIKTLISEFTKKIPAGCRVNDASMKSTILVLKGLGNAGFADNSVSRMLTKCMKLKSNPMTIRLVAIEAMRRNPCHSNKMALIFLLRDKSNNYEIRIAAYKMLMACTSKVVIDVVKGTLAKETVNQVSSYIWTHLSNLVKTSHTYEQHIRTVLDDEVLKRKFGGDRKRFARNHKAAGFTDQLNTGAKIEADLIWPFEKNIPHYGMLNITFDAFGQSVNLFEIGGRVEGVDRFFLKLLQSYKFLAKTSIGKSLKDILEDRENLQDKPDDLSGTFYLRIFGNEILYMDIKEADKFLSGRDIFSTLFIKDNNYTFAQSTVFLDNKYMFPIGSGFTLSLTLNGTANVDLLKQCRRDVIASDKFGIDRHIFPSATISIGSMMSVDTFATKSGIKMVSTLHSSSSLQGKIKRTDSLFLLEHNFPDTVMKIIGVESSVWIVRTHKELEQQPIGKNRKNIPYCYKQMSIFGLELCAEIEYPSHSTTSAALNFPLTGSFSAGVYLYKRDSHLKYKIMAKSLESSEQQTIHYLFDTPGSRKKNRKMKFYFRMNKQTGVIQTMLSTPWKYVEFEGKVFENDKEVTVSGTLTIDEKSKLFLDVRFKESSIAILGSITFPEHFVDVHLKGEHVWDNSYILSKLMLNSGIEQLMKTTFRVSFDKKWPFMNIKDSEFILLVPALNIDMWYMYSWKDISEGKYENALKVRLIKGQNNEVTNVVMVTGDKLSVTTDINLYGQSPAKMYFEFKVHNEMFSTLMSFENSHNGKSYEVYMTLPKHGHRGYLVVRVPFRTIIFDIFCEIHMQKNKLEIVKKYDTSESFFKTDIADIRYKVDRSLKELSRLEFESSYILAGRNTNTYIVLFKFSPSSSYNLKPIAIKVEISKSLIFLTYEYSTGLDKTYFQLRANKGNVATFNILYKYPTNGLYAVDYEHSFNFRDLKCHLECTAGVEKWQGDFSLTEDESLLGILTLTPPPSNKIKFKPIILSLELTGDSNNLNCHTEFKADAKKWQGDLSITTVRGFLGIFTLTPPSSNHKSNSITMSWEHTGNSKDFKCHAEFKADAKKWQGDLSIKTVGGVLGILTLTPPSSNHRSNPITMSWKHTGNSKDFKCHAEFKADATKWQGDLSITTVGGLLVILTLSPPSSNHRSNPITMSWKHTGNLKDFKCHAEFKADVEKWQGDLSITTVGGVLCTLTLNQPSSSTFEPIFISLKQDGNSRDFKCHVEFKRGIDKFQGYISLKLFGGARGEFTLTTPSFSKIKPVLISFEHISTKKHLSSRTDIMLGENKIAYKFVGMFEPILWHFDFQTGKVYINTDLALIIKRSSVGLSFMITSSLCSDVKGDFNVEGIFTDFSSRNTLEIEDKNDKHLVFNSISSEIDSPTKIETAMERLGLYVRQQGKIANSNAFNTGNKFKFTRTNLGEIIDGKIMNNKPNVLKRDLLQDRSASSLAKRKSERYTLTFSFRSTENIIFDGEITSPIEGYKSVSANYNQTINERYLKCTGKIETENKRRIFSIEIDNNFPTFDAKASLEHALEKSECTILLDLEKDINARFDIIIPKRDHINSRFTHSLYSEASNTYAQLKLSSKLFIDCNIELKWKSGFDVSLTMNTPFQGLEKIVLKTNHFKSHSSTTSSAGLYLADYSVEASTRIVDTASFTNADFVLQTRGNLKESLERFNNDIKASYMLSGSSSGTVITYEVDVNSKTMLNGKINKIQFAPGQMSANVELRTPLKNMEVHKVSYMYSSDSSKVECDINSSVFGNEISGTIAGSIQPLSVGLDIKTPFKEIENIGLNGVIKTDENQYFSRIQAKLNPDNQFMIEGGLSTERSFDSSISITTPFRQMRNASIMISDINLVTGGVSEGFKLTHNGKKVGVLNKR